MNITLFNDFIIDCMRDNDKKKILAEDAEILDNQSLSDKEVDSNIFQVMQQKREEKEALKKLLVNLNEPNINKRKQPK